MSAFDRSVLDLLDSARTVRIYTRGGPEGELHRTIIWIVVDDEGRVLARSVRGRRGRWYRELVTNPVGVLEAAGQQIPFRAVAADDEERIEACSRGFRAKYRPGGSLDSMLQPDILDTTLELRPA
jgi:hypothetical protein